MSLAIWLALNSNTSLVVRRCGVITVRIIIIIMFLGRIPVSRYNRRFSRL
jgi:hypothetical protein